MGNACSGAGLLTQGEPSPDVNGAAGEAPIHSGTQTHVIIIALDYPGTGHELTCTKDGNNMQQLCTACGVDDMTVLFNNEGNKQQVTQAIQDVGSRCDPGDFFVFYYSGHGTSVPDKSGDELDGKDEALCLVTPDGKIDFGAFMTDDEFAQLMQDNVDPSVNTIILTDCCHSGTIADFDSSNWGATKAVAMTGCTDYQTSGDTGNGGIFTHSLLMAIAALQANGDDDYSVGQLYNCTSEKDDQYFRSQQDISCAWSQGARSPTNVAWPLIPLNSYQAPMSG